MARTKKGNAKLWRPDFAKRRQYSDSVPMVEHLRQIFVENGGYSATELDAFITTFDCFENSLATCNKEAIIKFVGEVKYSDLETGTGPLCTRRHSWIDDRDVELAFKDNFGPQYEDEVMTAVELYRRLKSPRFNTPDKSSADRRLIMIQDLDPFFILALLGTATFVEHSALADMIWRHLLTDTSFKISITRGFPIFQLEFNMSFFVLKKSRLGQTLPSATTGRSASRRYIDCSFLDGTSDSSESDRSPGIHEQHISIMICGSDNTRWVGYCFADADEEDDLTDREFDPEYPLPFFDPIANGELDVNLPLWDPREYYITVFRIRLAQALKQWESITRKVEQGINDYQEKERALLPPETVAELRETLDFNQSSIDLLDQLIDTLGQTTKEWEVFSSKKGDITYLNDMTGAKCKPGYVRQSIDEITQTVTRMCTLRASLKRLARICVESSKAIRRHEAELRMVRRRNEQPTAILL